MVIARQPFVENRYLSLRFPNMVKVNIHEHWTRVTRFNPLWVSGVTHRIYTRTKWESRAKLLPLPHEITDNLARKKKSPALDHTQDSTCSLYVAVKLRVLFHHHCHRDPMIFLSYSFEIETINTFIHFRSSLENHTRFQTKTAQKPDPMERQYLYSIYRGVPPPPPPGLEGWRFEKENNLQLSFQISCYLFKDVVL